MDKAGYSCRWNSNRLVCTICNCLVRLEPGTVRWSLATDPFSSIQALSINHLPVVYAYLCSPKTTAFADKNKAVPKAKTAKESLAIATHLVLPNDTNTLGNLMGGQLLHWMDIIAAIAAHRHAHRIVVTASVNHVSFNQPISLGDMVTLHAKVSRAFSSSMEVCIDVVGRKSSVGR